MSQQRPRLSEDDMSLICSSLRARLAALSGPRRKRIERLLERLEDTGRGNPTWRFGWETNEDRDERFSATP